MNNKLLELLKDARVKKSLTQRDVAERLGVKDNTISNWETGKTEPDIETFITLCLIYGVNYTDLLEEVYRNKERPYEGIYSYTATGSEQELLEQYNKLDDYDKGKLDGFIRGLLSAEKYKKESGKMMFHATRSTYNAPPEFVPYDEKLIKKLEKLPKVKQKEDL